MPRESLTIEQILTLLAEGPPRIAALTADVAPARIYPPVKVSGLQMMRLPICARARTCGAIALS